MHSHVARTVVREVLTMFASDAVRLEPLMTLATTTRCTVYIVFRIPVRCVHTNTLLLTYTHYFTTITQLIYLFVRYKLKHSIVSRDMHWTEKEIMQ